MPLSAGKAGDLLYAELDWAKLHRRNLPYADHAQFCGRISIISPDGRPCRLPHRYSLQIDPLHATNLAACFAAEVHADAVMIAMDSTLLNVCKVALYLGLTVPIDASSYKNFAMEYVELLRSEPVILPEELWDRAIMVAIKGEGIDPSALSCPYIAHGDDVLFSLANPVLHPHETLINCIPNWWQIPEDDPIRGRIRFVTRSLGRSPKLRTVAGI